MIPLTKSKKNMRKKSEQYYYSFSIMQGMTSVAILSQIRLIDARRLSRYIGTMTEDHFMKLKEKLKALFP